MKQIVIFDGSDCRVVQYQGGRRDVDEQITGGDAAKQAAGLAEFWKWIGLLPRGAEPAALRMYPVSELDPAVIGVEQITGVDCVKVRSRGPSVGGEITWWVAQQYGYRVLRRDEVSYYPPGQGLQPGQYALVRTRVKEVRACGDGVYLPVHVEKTIAWINADGSVARVLRRFEFVADQVEVNQKVKADAFKVATVGESRWLGAGPR